MRKRLAILTLAVATLTLGTTMISQALPGQQWCTFCENQCEFQRGQCLGAAGQDYGLCEAGCGSQNCLELCAIKYEVQQEKCDMFHDLCIDNCYNLCTPV